MQKSLFVRSAIILALCGCNPEQENRLDETGQTAASPVPASVRVRPRSDSVTSAPVLVERHRLDMDGDGIEDELIVYSMNEYDNRIELLMSRAGRQSLDGQWDSPPAEFSTDANLIPSKLIFVTDYPEAGRLLFLFGPESGCCLPSLSIRRLGPSGAESYFDAEEFAFLKPPYVDGEKGVTMEVFLALGEGVDPPTDAFESASSYVPVHVIRLGRVARTDSAASAVRTRAKTGGFAGLSWRDDVLAVRTRDGVARLWDIPTGRLLP
jgi:hypothetical protein